MTDRAPQMNPPRGMLPVLQYCRPNQLAIDPSYQRSIETDDSQRLISRIARNWDWSLCQPLVVSQRADRQLYVVDGQHRLEAARIRGDISDLPCVVSPYADAASEAAAFVALNQERRPLGPVQLFRAAVASNDEAAVSIQRLLDNANLRLVAGADAKNWKPGDINNIAGIRLLHRRHGDRVSRVALELLASGFPNQVLRYCGTLYTGIAGVVAEFGVHLDQLLLRDVLAGIDHASWNREIATLAAEREMSKGLAAVEAIRLAYVEALDE